MRILYLITEGWFFESHFYERALAASHAGHEVYVAANIDGFQSRYDWAQFKVIQVSFTRSGTNPLRELATILQVLNVIKNVQPDLIHQIAMKPIIYGALAVYAARMRLNVVSAPVGMGYTFISSDLRAKFIRPIVSFLLKKSLRKDGSKVIFENIDDLNDFVRRGFVLGRDTYLIRGAGVNVDYYTPPNERVNSVPVITMVARMLRDKGVLDFVEAAAIVNRDRIRAVFNLVGDVDDGNPSSLDRGYLLSVTGKFGLVWLGHSGSVRDIYQSSDIACLPSYREGLPKSLIEAASCGLPIVTTDAVGCRELVPAGKNGILVPPRNPRALADALLKLIDNESLRHAMGVESRSLATERFSSSLIIDQTLAVYGRLHFD